MSPRYSTAWFHLDADRQLQKVPPRASRTVVGFLMLNALGRERSPDPLLPNLRCPLLSVFGLNPVAPGVEGGTA